MSTTVNKPPNTPTQFSWDYEKTDEANIDGFDVILENKGANTSGEKVAISAHPDDRLINGYLSPMLGGQYYYIIRAFFNDDTAGVPTKIYSSDSNEVAINVVVLPVVTNVDVR